MSKIYNELKDLEHIEEDNLEHIEIIEEGEEKEQKRNSFFKVAGLTVLFLFSMIAGFLIAKQFVHLNYKNLENKKNQQVAPVNYTVKKMEDKMVENKKKDDTLKVTISLQKTTSFVGNDNFIKKVEKAYLDDKENSLKANNLSVAYCNIGRLEDSLKLAEKALYLAPDNAFYWNNLGVVLTYLNLYTDAEKCFKKALEISPEEGVFYYNLGNLYERMGNETLAREKYLSYIAKTDKINPENVRVIKNMFQ